MKKVLLGVLFAGFVFASQAQAGDRPCDRLLSALDNADAKAQRGIQRALDANGCDTGGDDGGGGA